MGLGSYEIPTCWPKATMGECLALVRNGTAKRQNKDGRGLPVSRIETISRDLVDQDKVGYLEGLGDTEVNTYRLRKGDILFSHINSEPQLGRTALYLDSPPVLIHGMNLLMLRAGSRLDPVFLHLLCVYLRDCGVFIALAGRAVGQSSINQGKLRALDVPVPPISEQRRIAALLSAAQRAIEQQERLVTLATELKKVLMRKLFTEGTRGEPQKETEIGLVPESWELAPLGATLRERLRNGKSAKETNETGVRTLTLTAVTRNDFGLHNTKVTCADPRTAADLWLKSGDIFIERANTSEYVGLAALFEGPDHYAIFPDLLVRVRPKSSLRPKYLHEFLSLPAVRLYFQRNAKGTTGNFPKIDHGTIEALTLALAPHEEQLLIEEIARAVDDRLEQCRGARALLQALFRTLLHQLMTAQLRVDQVDMSELKTLGIEVV